MIAVFAGIFVGCSTGQECENRGDETHLRIRNCDIESFRELVRSFDRESIVELKAEPNQNKNFQTIDTEMFKDMRNLVELTFTGCGIEAIAEDAFSELKSLRVLDLGDN